LISVGICLVSLSFSVRFSKISGVFFVSVYVSFPVRFLVIFAHLFFLSGSVCLFVLQLCLCGCMCLFCFFFVCLCLFCFFFACLCFFLSVNQPFSRCLCLNWSRQTQSSKVIEVQFLNLLKKHSKFEFIK
jgi:hypothetical protein